MKKISLYLHLLISLMFLYSSSPSQTFGDTFQWTDDSGTIHFSDSLSNVPKNKRVERREETPVSSQASNTASDSKRVKVKPVKNDEGQENSTYDPFIEQEVRRVWDAFYDAMSRKDADAAVDLLIPGKYEDVRQEFRKNRDKLPRITKDGAVLKLKKVYDQNYAICIAVRDEMVKGQMKTVAYPVNFWKVNGEWKLAKP